MSPYILPGILKNSMIILRDYTVENVAKHVCECTGISVTKMQSRSRKREIVEARQIAMYTSRKYTNESLKTIARYFGGRDHTTAIHSCQTVDDLKAHDTVYSQRLDAILNSFETTVSRMIEQP